MTIRDTNSSPATPEQDESLSATGMFLRSFEKQGTEQAQASENSAVPASPVQAERPAASAPAPPQRSPQKPNAGGGEFTQFFQTLGNRPVEPASGGSQSVSAKETNKPGTTQDGTAGEFTRIFSGAASASASGSQPVSSSGAPGLRAKGFSTPGAPESASSGGGFTQFFKATPVAPKPASPAPAAPVPSEKTWEHDFRPAETQPKPSAPGGSVTSILSSLASPSAGTDAVRQSEPGPYRVEPVSAAPPSMTSPASSPAEPGGVTRLIKKLAQEPVTPPPATAPSPVVIPSNEPGEFTRMISKIGGTGTAPARTDAGTPVLPAANPAPAVSVQMQPPQIPTMPAPPPMAASPAPMPNVSAQVSVAHPQAPAIPTPPKIAPPQPPGLALTPPKSKLEAMVPMLLVINTFLLLIVLVVLIFLIKGR